MIRKFLLTGLILFLAPGSIAQLACALLIGAYFMAAHVKYTPFISDDETNLQTISLISTVLILVLGIMLKAKDCPIQMEDSANGKYDHPPPALLLFLCAITSVFGAGFSVMAMRKKVYDQLTSFTKYNARCTVLLTCLAAVLCCASACCYAATKEEEEEMRPEEDTQGDVAVEMKGYGEQPSSQA
jgi:heme/copper-type cytochrome/quinol oxidase subunit 3